MEAEGEWEGHMQALQAETAKETERMSQALRQTRAESEDLRRMVRPEHVCLFNCPVLTFFFFLSCLVFSCPFCSWFILLCPVYSFRAVLFYRFVSFLA